MTSASTLINGLTGEKVRWMMMMMMMLMMMMMKVRWTETSKNLKEQLGRLIGDTLLACGFLSYAGPFNQEYRNHLLLSWKNLLKQRNVSFTKELNVVNMLVDSDETSEWALQGLPNDELSLQVMMMIMMIMMILMIMMVMIMTNSSCRMPPLSPKAAAILCLLTPRARGRIGSRPRTNTVTCRSPT